METLEKITNEFTSLEVGTSRTYGSLTLKFGYWKKVDTERLEEILPKHFTVEENLVDENDDCGELYNYIIGYGDPLSFDYSENSLSTLQ